MNIIEAIRPRPTIATRDYIAEVKHDLEIDDNQAAKIADYIVNQVEQLGGERAVLYIDNKGQGPCCSWCGAIAGLCPHIVGRKKDCACAPLCEGSCECNCHGGVATEVSA